MNAIMVLFFGVLGFVLLGKVEREHLQGVQTFSRADVAASSAILLRTASKCYLHYNPGHSGEITWANISASTQCRPLGMQAPLNLKATVDGGRLYVYSTAAVSPETLSRISEKMHRSPIVAKNVSGMAISVAGTLGGFHTPSTIPNDALVIVGN